MSYTVICAILGHEELFSVEIESNKPVSELKNRIKAQEALPLAASALKLYRVDIPVSDHVTLMESISRKTVAYNEDQRFQNPIVALSTVFGATFSEGTLHILVDCPKGESFSSS